MFFWLYYKDLLPHGGKMKPFKYKPLGGVFIIGGQAFDACRASSAVLPHLVSRLLQRITSSTAAAASAAHICVWKVDSCIANPYSKNGPTVRSNSTRWPYSQPSPRDCDVTVSPKTNPLPLFSSSFFLFFFFLFSCVFFFPSAFSTVGPIITNTDRHHHQPTECDRTTLVDSPHFDCDSTPLFRGLITVVGSSALDPPTRCCLRLLAFHSPLEDYCVVTRVGHQCYRFIHPHLGPKWSCKHWLR